MKVFINNIIIIHKILFFWIIVNVIKAISHFLFIYACNKTIVFLTQEINKFMTWLISLLSVLSALKVEQALFVYGIDFSMNDCVITAVTLCPSLSSDVLSTTTAPTSPSPPSVPERGSYNITNNGTACLLACMGLQLNITYTSRSQGKVLSLSEPFTNSLNLPWSKVLPDCFFVLIWNTRGKQKCTWRCRFWICLPFTSILA